MAPNPNRVNWHLFWRFHKDYGHNTENCMNFNGRFQGWLSWGIWINFRIKWRSMMVDSEWRDPAGRRIEITSNLCRLQLPTRNNVTTIRIHGGMDEEVLQPTGIGSSKYGKWPAPIHMISGGPTCGDSKSARKHYRRFASQDAYKFGNIQTKSEKDWESQPITFDDADMKGVDFPHDDPIVIVPNIANHPVHRVMIDNGSSVNGIRYCNWWMAYATVIDGERPCRGRELLRR